MRRLQYFFSGAEKQAERVIFFGFWLYLVSIFFIDSSRQSTVFYIGVALPGLFMLARARSFFSSKVLSGAVVLAFIFYLALSSLWAGPEGDVADAFKFGLYLVLLMLAIQAVCKRLSSSQILHGVLWAGGASVLVYLVFILQQDFSIWLKVRANLERISGWGENNPISSAIILGLPVLAAWVCFPEKKKWQQAGLALLIVAGFCMMLLTKSRGPILAILLTIVVLCCYRRTREDFFLLLGLSILAIVLLMFDGVWYLVQARVEQSNYRLLIWQEALEQITSQWLFGYGHGSEAGIAITAHRVVTHAHNSILEVLRVGGLVGGVLFVVMLWQVLRGAAQRKVNLFFFLWLFYGLLCLSTNGRILLIRPTIEWTAFWLPLLFLLFADPLPATKQQVPDNREQGSAAVEVH